ncbi:Agamous-like MADS-box protein AGL80 isoform B [Glycine soja]|uniref:Agamous-like MADS-box protein AGL80 isoform B n=1 Tax=Glycine soja TaxID=3848 RepID=A0A445L957_GLYSO|nr:Agamous-like MADS-box protein AGL80 isoform B [Glycine soja]
MARKKVDITYISNPTKRKATFKKRKNDEPAKPEVWPSDQGVKSVISSFREVSKLEQSKKMLCQESLLRKNLIKAQEQLKKLKTENRKKEMSLLMSQYFTIENNLENSNTVDLNDNSFLADKNLEEIRMKIDMHQPQEVAPTVEKGGETMYLGDQGLVNYHVQGPETNGDAMPNL